MQCCTNKSSCGRDDPKMFVPVLSHKKRKEYEEALDAYKSAVKSKDVDALTTARLTIGALAVVKCAPCREVNARSYKKPGTARGDCYVEWERLKREVFHTCACCGTHRQVEANHRTSYAENKKRYDAHVRAAAIKAVALRCPAPLRRNWSRKKLGAAIKKAEKAPEIVEEADRLYPAAERKLQVVSRTPWWACNGGVPAMRLEAAKCDPLCRMCHTLDDSSNSAECNRADPAKVQRENYATQKKYDRAVYMTRYRMEKRDYVNGIKRLIGCCERPVNCPSRDGPARDGECVAGFEQMYDWDHILEAIKGRALSAICCDCRCLKTAKPEILAELGFPADFDVDNDAIPAVSARRCRLLCSNCHQSRKTWE